MDFFAPIFNFIIDSSKKLSHRAATVIVAIFVLLLLDNILGFSYYYNLDKKVEVINNINQALRDTSNSASEKHILVQLKENIINHTSIKDNIYGFLFNKNWRSSINFSNLSNIFSLITACSFPLFMMISVLIVSVPMLFKKKRLLLDDDNQTIIFKVAGFELFCYIVCIVEVKTLLRIPSIYDIIYLNYILNLAVNFLLLLLFIKLVVDKGPKGFLKTSPKK